MQFPGQAFEPGAQDPRWHDGARPCAGRATVVRGALRRLAAGPGPACPITYTYNVPANACDTGVVAYKTNGNNSNNDIIDDGIRNGSACAAAGYAYVDASGKLTSCHRRGG